MTGHRTAPPPPQPRFVRRIPDGDTAERYVCGDCGHVYYTNPKIVVGSVVTYRDRVLLCRRAIEPRKGLWTLSSDAARRKLPMSAEDLLEAEVLIYLRGLGFSTDRRSAPQEADRQPGKPAGPWGSPK